MITSAVLEFFGIALSIVTGLPKVESMPFWYLPLSEVFQAMSGLMSLPLIGTCFTIFLLVMTILSGWQLVVFGNWLYNKVRGSG